MELVRVRDPENMNLFGLLLAGYFQSRLASPALMRRARKLSGDLCLRAGPLWATLRFDGDGIEVIRGRTGSARATVQGEMHTLLGVVTGQGMVRPFLRRQVRIAGDPLFLLKMMPLLISR